MQNLKKPRAISDLPKEQRFRTGINRDGTGNRGVGCTGVSNSEGGQANSPARFPPGLPAQIPQIALCDTIDVTKATKIFRCLTRPTI